MIAGMDLPTIEASALLEKIEAGDAFALVDALAPMVYAHSHLPGAINLAPNDIDPETISRRIGDRDAEIVVYCTNPACQDSVQTTRRLRELGYANVRHYAA